MKPLDAHCEESLLAVSFAGDEVEELTRWRHLNMACKTS